MLDATVVVGSVAAGACCAGAVFVGFGGGRGLRAVAIVHRLAPPLVQRSLNARSPLEWLASDIERAGWRESPERIAVLAGALSASLALLGASAGQALALGGVVVMSGLGILAGLALPTLALRSAIARRRRRLEGELVPLLELFTLELSGGGSAISALGSVTMQVQGELATDMRRLLIATQVAGSSTFESRLVEYSERLEIPAISSLATILASSREYGTGAVHGVRALATDLRRAQRRQLIADSRRALNHVLLPAAVGVLLPFLAVLMFPAVTALQRSLR